jgi:hypothetical protein
MVHGKKIKVSFVDSVLILPPHPYPLPRGERGVWDRSTDETDETDGDLVIKD